MNTLAYEMRQGLSTRGSPLDPRRLPVRLSPMILTALTAGTIAFMLWRLFEPAPQVVDKLSADAAIALETRAFAMAARRDGFTRPIDVPVSVPVGGNLLDAIMHTGVSASEANAAVSLLAQSIDVIDLKKSVTLQAAIAKPLNDALAQPQLLGLTIRTSPAKQLTLSKSADGAMRLRPLEEPVRDERRVVTGRIEGSIYTSALALGVTPAVTSEVYKLFAHKFDFERDFRSDDRFKLVFDRKVTESGRTVAAGNLLFAEIEAKGTVTRFYNFQRAGQSRTEFFDATGKNIKGFLMATPVSGARSSSGFGMRLHPIMGFMKMHTGIDFAAQTGTPILAAGNGIVTEARWNGGYGRWVRLNHTQGWDTGYAHMSAVTVRPGQRVSQGDVIGYVGTTGRSTGPHLHFEVWHNGRPIDPKSARVPQGTILSGNDLTQFRARKRDIDKIIAGAEAQKSDEDQSQTVAMLATDYHFESEKVADAGPVATRIVGADSRVRTYAALRPALNGEKAKSAK